ncbi:MAG: ABC transporter ATP-binding protein/permease [Tannerellaceae bacterium]|nr:ABC transporter ATP-binding protein/permease [Tannerellaceae bacterium]
MEQEEMTTGKNMPKAAVRTLRRLVSYLACDRPILVGIFCLIMIGISADLTGSYLLRPIINDYILPGDLSGLVRMLTILAGVYLAGIAAVWIRSYLLNRVAQRTVHRMRRDLFEKMEHLPIKYFDENQHGDLMSRYTNDIDRISDALTDSLSDMFSSVLTLTGIFVLMLYISPVLTLVALITVPLMMLSARRIVKKSSRYFKAQQASLGDMNGYIEEMISGQKVVKVFGHEPQVEEGFRVKNQDLQDKSLKAQFYSGMMMPVMQNLNTLTYVFITIVGGILAIYRGFDIGGLATFLQYSRQFGRPINELASLYTTIQAALAGAERIFQVMDEEPEPADAPDAVTIDQMKGEVALDQVYFSYDPGKTILKDINLCIPAGKKIALVGTTGAGKTTILNMLPRFYDIESGDITIDDISLYKIKRESLRKMMAIVLQDTHLFTGTVRENIRFGRLDATDEEVIEAARLTSTHSFIKRLQHGYDTMLYNDGENLSQGQRQLLNIARAAIANPTILLLDEATSNIDTRSEIRIQKGLDRLMEGRTSFVIAHRLSTIKNADQIVVLEYGQVIEKGTHQELLDRKGKYYSLYKEQFG